nr:hypothetical protein [uncultured Deefgea sp.]
MKTETESKPLGIVLLALYCIVNGLMAIPLGCTGAAVGAVPGVDAGLEPLGYLLMVMGLLSLAEAYGVWTLQSWGRFLAQFNSVISILIVFFSVLGMGGVFTSTKLTYFITVLISGWVLYYMSRDDIKPLFEEQEDDDFGGPMGRREPMLSSKDNEILERDY